MKNSVLDDDSNKFAVLRMVNDGVSRKDIAESFSVSYKTICKFLNKETYAEFWRSHKKPIASGEFYDHHHDVEVAKGKRFILTSAQNNTFVHGKFLASLENYAEFIGAQIIVGTFSYNLNEFQNLGKGDGEWFDDKIRKYIVDKPLKLAEGLLWCGELNVLPTATNPLSGFHNYTMQDSGIIPHAKVNMESLPRHPSAEPRFLYTTGAVTKRNYVQKKAGQKASFHHIFGALIVEVDKDGDWFVRQLIADTDSGSFHDLEYFVDSEGVANNLGVEGINWGDIHAEKLDDVVAQASFGNDNSSMIDVLRPKYQFVHDVLDFQSRNHHSINDPYHRFSMFINGVDTVEGNIDKVVDVLNLMHRPFCETVIVESNHDLALQKWLKTADYKTDPCNAVFFLDCQLATYKSMLSGEKNFSVFEYAVRQKNPDIDVRFLKTDESFIICGNNGVECGNHGHMGINGSRGTALAYTKVGNRVNIGHSHSARIVDGVYQAGVTGLLDMDYNKGNTSWSHSHIVTYTNGKRTIVTLKKGKWRCK